MKMSLKNLFVLVAVLACAFSLTGCLSHLFVDSTTRLQVENKTDSHIVSFGILSDDGSYWPWINDTIAPGEKSRVYEEDFVGSFRARIQLESGTCYDPVPAETENKCTGDCVRNCSVTLTKEYFTVDFDGGSYYMVVKEEKGEIKLEFR
jgi:hypothetical protein